MALSDKVTAALDEYATQLTDSGRPDIAKRLRSLRDVVDVATEPGNAYVDHYMRGMANGLLLAVSCFTGLEPEYIEADAVQSGIVQSKLGEAWDHFDKTPLPRTADTFAKHVQDGIERNRVARETYTGPAAPKPD